MFSQQGKSTKLVQALSTSFTSNCVCEDERAMTNERALNNGNAKLGDTKMAEGKKWQGRQEKRQESRQAEVVVKI